MVLEKLQVPGRPTIWVIVGQGPIALAVGAGGGGLFCHFSLIYPRGWSGGAMVLGNDDLKFNDASTRWVICV